MNARMQRKFTHLLAEGNTAFVMVCHTMTDIGSMSRDPLLISGGRAITYGASIIMDLRKRSLQESDPVSNTEGMKIGVSIKKNHCVCDRNPYVKTEYFVIYGQGTEQFLSTLDKAVQQNVLRKAGAWIYDDANNLSWMGKAKYREHCKDNPDYFKTLVNRISGIQDMDAAEVADAKALEDVVSTAIDLKKGSRKKAS